MPESYDLVVIGSSGAAMAAGIETRSRGKSVLLVEHGVLGGTCLNIGCVPSKNLPAAASQRHRALHNPFRMVPTSAGGVNVPASLAQKQELIDRSRQAKYIDVADAHGFPIRYGHATFGDEQKVLVDGKPITAPACVVAAGAGPAVPDVPGIGEVAYLTSTTAMDQQELPHSLVAAATAGSSARRTSRIRWRTATLAARSRSSSTRTSGRSSACTPRSTGEATSCSPPPTPSSSASPSTMSPTPGPRI